MVGKSIGSLDKCNALARLKIVQSNFGPPQFSVERRASDREAGDVLSFTLKTADQQMNADKKLSAKVFSNHRLLTQKMDNPQRKRGTFSN